MAFANPETCRYTHRDEIPPHLHIGRRFPAPDLRRRDGRARACETQRHPAPAPSLWRWCRARRTHAAHAAARARASSRTEKAQDEERRRAPPEALRALERYGFVVDPGGIRAMGLKLR